jgi:hypothetical protein
MELLCVEFPSVMAWVTSRRCPPQGPFSAVGVREACAPRGETANWVSGEVTQEQHIAGLGRPSGSLYAGESKGNAFLVVGQLDRYLAAVCVRGLDWIEARRRHLVTVARALVACD